MCTGQSRKLTIRTQLLPVYIFRPDLSPLSASFHNSLWFLFFVSNLSAYTPPPTITHLPDLIVQFCLTYCNMNTFPNSGHYALQHYTFTF